MRASGVLMPVSSIPSDYGIGCFSKEAYEFVDQLAEAGQKYWQILPLGPTGYGDSPYQSCSTFAGNPYFIDLGELIRENLLTEEECSSCDWGDNPSYVDYEKIYNSRFLLLRKAYDRAETESNEEYQEFLKQQNHWIWDYALFMAIKDSQKGISWAEWPREFQDHDSDAVKKARQELDREVGFYCFQQYLFHRQWMKLKEYANQKGIGIIGDVPIYVAPDSADAWADPGLFQFDENYLPVAVAGCPPDAFSATGQLWGIRCMTGKNIKKRVTSGGLRECSDVWNFMISSVSIISEVLTSIIPFLMETRPQRKATGRKARDLNFSMY